MDNYINTPIIPCTNLRCTFILYIPKNRGNQYFYIDEISLGNFTIDEVVGEKGITKLLKGRDIKWQILILHNFTNKKTPNNGTTNRGVENQTTKKTTRCNRTHTHTHTHIPTYDASFTTLQTHNSNNSNSIRKSFTLHSLHFLFIPPFYTFFYTSLLLHFFHITLNPPKTNQTTNTNETLVFFTLFYDPDPPNCYQTSKTNKDTRPCFLY